MATYQSFYCTASPDNYFNTIYPFSPFTYSYEEAVSINPDRNMAFMTINDDYSFDLNIKLPTTVTQYDLSWYTCENFWNPATPSETVPLPDLSKVTVEVRNPTTGSSVSYVITNPAQLVLNVDNEWEYTSPACQFNVEAQSHSVRITMEFDYSSSPVTIVPWGSYQNYDMVIGGPTPRPVIGYTYNPSGYVSGSILPYDTGAGCNIVNLTQTSNGKKPRRNVIR